MFYYFLIIIFLFILSFLYMLNTHKIVQNELEMKYNKWKRLNSLVSTRNKNKLTIIIISLNLICQAIWITFLQKVNKTIKKINRNKGNTYMTDEERNMTPKQRREREEQGRKNLALEVISRLKNR